MQDTFNTTIIQEINELRATKESLQKELTAKEELKNKIILQNAQLKEQLIAIKKFNAENSSIPYEPAPIIIKQQPTKKITPKKNVNARKKKAASKKKKAFTAAAQNNKPIIQTNASPQNNSNSHESQQKMSRIAKPADSFSCCGSSV